MARPLTSFVGMAGTTLVINEAVFSLSVFGLQYLVADALGNLLVGPINYLVSHRFIFVISSGH